jgi:hypothetical protein
MDTALTVIHDNLRHLYAIIPEICAAVLGESFITRCQEMMNSPPTVTLGCHLFADYLVLLDLREHVFEFVTSICQKVSLGRREFTESLFECLGKVLGSLPFPEEEAEAAQQILDYFFELLRSDELEDEFAISDAGLVAMSKFVKANFGLFDERAVIRQWTSCFPLWDAPTDSDAVFVLLADILEDGLGDIMGQDWLGWTMQTVVAAHIGEQCTPETGARLGRFLVNAGKDPSLAAAFAEALESLSATEARSAALEQCLQNGTKLLLAQQSTLELSG